MSRWQKGELAQQVQQCCATQKVDAASVNYAASAQTSFGPKRRVLTMSRWQKGELAQQVQQYCSGVNRFNMAKNERTRGILWS